MSVPLIDSYVLFHSYVVPNEDVIQVPGIKELVADQLHTEIRRAAAQIDNAKEVMLLKFFGSFENAEKWNHLFIIEERPGDITQKLYDDFNILEYRLEYSWNLRMKTPEEIFGPYAEKFMNDNKDWSPATARD